MHKLLIALLLALCIPVVSQGQEATVNAIGVALKSGDAAALAEHFAENVSIGLSRSEKNYSKAQAQQVIQSFFSRNTVTDFVYRHSGKSEHKDQFNVGTLSTEKGLYRVTYFLIQNPRSSKIKRLRIELK